MRNRCFEIIDEIARADSRIVFIGSDIGRGTLQAFREEFPQRFFIEGVSEQHIVSMASGMAMEGLIPFVCSLGSFITRRSYEQILIDVCLHNLPVRFVCFGGGSVYSALGPTHIVNEDIALLRSMPNMCVIAACDADEIARLLRSSVTHGGPIYFRFARGEDAIVSRDSALKIGEAVPYFPPQKLSIFTTGIMLQRAIEVREMLAADRTDCGILHFPTVTPLDEAYIREYSMAADAIVTLEEHFVSSGFGSSILEFMSLNNLNPSKVKLLGFPKCFMSLYGVQEDILDRFGLSPSKIFLEIKSFLRTK